MKDPIVAEVRRYRMEHTQKFGGDLNKIYEDLLRIQKESGRKLVQLPPRMLASKRAIGKESPETQ
jgi:hypothetical protein